MKNKKEKTLRKGGQTLESKESGEQVNTKQEAGKRQWRLDAPSGEEEGGSINGFWVGILGEG